MIKDRIVEIGTKRVLLPERCSGPSETCTVKELLAILASDRHSVLITGETGTGKEMLADCVMHMTKRPKGNCQRLNCAGLDSNLVGSELFGHKEGAFTGAVDDRKGLLMACDGGVLFLDEIGWLLPDLQARLLRFMETGEIRPIGADRIEHHANVRIVAATNKDVEKADVMIHDLRARFDFEVRLPPLRERGGDILWFLCEPGFLGSEEVFTGITLRTLVGILTRKWLGNIRELKKCCQRKVVLNPIERREDEKRHILEDCDIGEPSTIDGVVGFAGLALSAYESYGVKNKAARLAPHARRVAALLAGLFSGMKGSLRDLSESVAVVPLTVLRAAINGELQECGEFDLDIAILKPLAACEPAAYSVLGDAMRLTHEMDFAGALIAVLRLAEAVNLNMHSSLTREGSGGGKSARVPVEPSKAFLEEIGGDGPGGVLFAMPPPPAGGGGFEQVLDKLGIKEPDRRIALLCNEGKSNKEIGRVLKLGRSNVQYRLVKLRREKELGESLPKHAAGRKPRNRPD